MKTFFVVPRRREEEEGKQQQKSNKAPFSHPLLRDSLLPRLLQGHKRQFEERFLLAFLRGDKARIFLPAPYDTSYVLYKVQGKKVGDGGCLLTASEG